MLVYRTLAAVRKRHRRLTYAVATRLTPSLCLDYATLINLPRTLRDTASKRLYETVFTPATKKSPASCSHKRIRTVQEYCIPRINEDSNVVQFCLNEDSGGAYLCFYDG